ncbi:unnamed protein product [Strongylus vulgaris]|uniref:Uncharacterized protein n=1 Tax=Strongylus vulgaris TaxID=40348 RepID=A0A3P7I3Q9_STRVU|nr:unnamed protein product [Strongylus vulgaris]
MAVKKFTGFLLLAFGFGNSFFFITFAVSFKGVLEVLVCELLDCVALTGRDIGAALLMLGKVGFAVFVSVAVDAVEPLFCELVLDFVSDFEFVLTFDFGSGFFASATVGKDGMADFVAPEVPADFTSFEFALRLLDFGDLFFTNLQHLLGKACFAMFASL